MTKFLAGMNIGRARVRTGPVVCFYVRKRGTLLAIVGTSETGITPTSKDRVYVKALEMRM